MDPVGYTVGQVLGRLIPPAIIEKALAHSIRRHAFRVLDDVAMYSDRRALWTALAEHVGVDTSVRVLEFGVWRGYSLRAFARLFSNPESRFYGFDSFLGLPEGWEKKEKGAFTTAGAVPDFEDPRVTVIPGWFQDTLGSFLERNVDAGNEWTTVVHFDADLYSSTLYVLMTLAARLERCYVVFDEFHGDEMRALHNFLQARGGSVSFLGRTARAVQVCGLLETGGGEYMPESIEAAAKTSKGT